MLKGLEEILAKHDLSDEIKKALMDDVNGAADGLINKKSELELKIANKDGLTAAEKVKLIELESFKNNSEIASAKAAQDWQTASDLQAKAWELEKSTMQSENTSFKLDRDNNIIDNGINSKLTSLGVKPDSRNDIFNSMKFQSKIVDGKAMVGDQTQSDFIDAWALSNSGKAAVLAQENSGGDGQGGDNQKHSPSSNQAALDAQAKGDIQGYLKAVQAEPQN